MQLSDKYRLTHLHFQKLLLLEQEQEVSCCKQESFRYETEPLRGWKGRLFKRFYPKVSRLWHGLIEEAQNLAHGN